MEIDVYDTYALAPDGAKLHFDVLVPAGSGSLARDYATGWLRGLGIAGSEIRLQQCRYCHSEPASPEIARQILREGFFIFQMEGCPSPIF